MTEWRVCHGYPINTFQATLRDKLNKLSLGERSLVAQRLKRAPTIIDKLKRYPKMKLSQMQDIGGVRAVVPSEKDVRKLVAEYKSSKFKHRLIREKDYISNPRREDGYRSYHLIYEYNNPKAPEYKGLALELQLRTKLQHSWATAVETVGFILNQALKSRHGDKEWLEFFATVSAAFAREEGTEPVPEFEKMSVEKTYKAVAEINQRLGALNTIRGFPVAIELINNREGTRFFYYLIRLDLEQRTISMRGFPKDQLNAANTAYSDAEKEIAESNKNIELVLVSAGKIRSLRKAYPNFFLDSKDFIDQVERVIAKA